MDGHCLIHAINKVRGKLNLPPLDIKRTRQLLLRFYTQNHIGISAALADQKNPEELRENLLYRWLDDDALLAFTHMFNCKFVLYHINEHYKDDDGNNITEYTTIEKESYSSSRPPHTIHLLLTNSTHFEPLFVQTKAASSSTSRNPPQVHSAPALHSRKAVPTNPRDVSSTSEATTTTAQRKQLSVQQLPPPLPLTKNQRATAPKKPSEHHHEQPQSSLPSPITSKTISQAAPSLLTSPAQATTSQDNASPSVNSPSQRRIAAAPPLNKPLSNYPLILKPAPASLRLVAHPKRRSKTTVKEKPPSKSRSKQFSPQDPITSNLSSPPSPQAAAAQSSQDQPPQKKQKLLSDYFPPPKNQDTQSLSTRKRKLPHDLQALETSQQPREQKQTQTRHIP
jgi:hypothetical protein